MGRPKIITSVSGGRTSGYLALHYPQDYCIFSLVRIEDRSCTPKDKSIIRYTEDKIGMDFIATAESDKTLYVLRELEQELGQEIIWVTGDTFEQVIRNHSKALPNRRMRFCTTDMKMTPIFWWTYLNVFRSEDDFVEMNIGYRADEPKRSATDVFRFAKSTKNFGLHYKNWEEIEWRDSLFPLREDGITNLEIKSFWAKKPNYIFPKESNCVGCFNKTPAMLQDQWIEEPQKMAWFARMERETGNKFANLGGISYEDIRIGKFKIEDSEDFTMTCNCHD